MRLSSRKARRTSLELQMTSMIDVVFLLLIFFMTTSSFIHSERELDPVIHRAESAAPSQRTREPLVVELVWDGTRWGWRLGGRDVFSRTELKSILQTIDNREDGAIVKAPDDAPFESAAHAIQACREAGFSEVVYDPAGAASGP